MPIEALDQRQFYWIVFDTGARPEYYLDVHNLLAQPTGSVIRYNYKTKYFSDAALVRLRQDYSGQRVLFVYAQYSGFVKRDSLPGRFDETCAKIHHPTRLGKLLWFSIVADKVILDFQLLGYPASDADIQAALVSELTSKGEVPFKKFVAVSERWDWYDGLSTDDPHQDRENWASVVKALDTGTQFNGDSFWRVTGPLIGGSHKQVVLTMDKVRDGVTYHFRLPEGEQCYFLVENLESSSRDLAENPRFLRVSVDQESIHSRESVMELRQYFESNLYFSAKRRESLQPTQNAILFSTETADGEPTNLGARFSLPVKLATNSWKTAGGCFLLLAGILVGYMAVGDEPSIKGGALLALGVLLGGAGSLLLYGKISVSSGG